MIRTQLELFPEKIKKTKSIIIRKSSSNHFRGWNDIMTSIAKNFSISDRKYFAGMIDGDGSFHLPKNNLRKLRIALELRHDHAEPVLRLAELFDLTISKIFRLNRKNAQPSLRVELNAIKAKLFLYTIHPYLLEKKDNARKVLLALDCPEEYLQEGDERQFSFVYLAGYTDAEGCVRFNLLHLKTKIGNITSSYRTGYVLTSNDNAHLQFIKQRLIDQGFDHFRKDYIDTYKNSKRKNRKPTTQITLGGSPTQLSKFYEKVEPFMLIKHKKDNMRHTILYDQITNRRVYREVE
jgi:hypothetical protein